MVESADLAVDAPAPRRDTGLPGWAAVAATIPAILLTAVYEWSSRQAAGASGFPLDDAWIHAQFARNLASGLGFTYTGSEWVAGSTAPAWSVALALASRVVPDMVLAAKALGILCQIVTGYAAARLVWRLTGSAAAAAGAACGVASVPVVVWGAVSGMEVPLSTALVASGLLVYHIAYASKRMGHSVAALALLAASCLARPENVSLAGLAIAHFSVFGGATGSRLRRLVLGVAVLAVVVAPAVWLSEATIGRPLPTTFYAKSGPGVVRAVETRDTAMLERNLLVFGPRAVRQFGDTLLDQLGPVAWFAPVGLVVCALRRQWRIALLLAVLLVVVPYAIGLVAPQRLKPENVRYVGQLVVIAAMLSFVAAAPLLDRLYPVIRYALSAGLAAIICYGAYGGAAEFALSVKNIQQLHVEVGKWARDRIPAGSVVAANDVGAIAYFSGHRIMDIEGLVTPAALAYRGRPERGLAFVRDVRPDFVVIFPHWYPEIPRHPELFTEVHRVTIDDNLVSAGSTLVVYRTVWAHRRSSVRGALHPPAGRT
jgi:hypothetical protein